MIWTSSVLENCVQDPLFFFLEQVDLNLKLQSSTGSEALNTVSAGLSKSLPVVDYTCADVRLIPPKLINTC